jgi:hypothetical protein
MRTHAPETTAGMDASAVVTHWWIYSVQNENSF